MHIKVGIGICLWRYRGPSCNATCQSTGSSIGQVDARASATEQGTRRLHQMKFPDQVCYNRLQVTWALCDALWRAVEKRAHGHACKWLIAGS
eukprot:1139540-Pelagomonas_calceolata.AAC.2